jgi:hypothetical protein
MMYVHGIFAGHGGNIRPTREPTPNAAVPGDEYMLCIQHDRRNRSLIEGFNKAGYLVASGWTRADLLPDCKTKRPLR